MTFVVRILIIPMALLIACSPRLSTAQTMLPAHDTDNLSPDVLAVINGDTITAADLEAAILDVHAGMDRDGKMNFKYDKLFAKLVNDRLLVQEAINLGLDQEPWLIRQMDESRRENAIRYFVKNRFHPDLAVSEAEIETFFAEYYRRMQLRTVSIDHREDAENMAAAVSAGADMDSLARAVSLDTQRHQGGLHNFKYWIDIENALKDEAVSLEPGRVSRVFPYRQVYAFLRVEKTSPADPADLPQYSRKIQSILTGQKQKDAWKIFVDSLAERFPIVIDSAALKRIAGDAAKLYTSEFVVDDETVAMRIGSDHMFTVGQLRNTISRTAMSNGDRPFDEILIMGLEDAREELILSAAAADNGYLNNQDVVQKFDKSYDSALIEVYIQETIIPRIRFNNDEFQVYYNDHLDDFREPDQYQIERMEVADQTQATEIVARLADGADFEYIARQYGATLASEKDRNQWLPLDILPSGVRQELENIQIGRTSRAFQTLDGWMIFRIKARREGAVKSLADVDMDIRQIMFQKKFNELLDETIAILKENSDIKFNDKALKEYFGGNS